MDLRSFKTLAAVSVVALSAAAYSSGVFAASTPSQVVAVPGTIEVGADVLNTVTVTVDQPMTFGQIAAIEDPTDTGTLSMDPTTGDLTDDGGGGYTSTSQAAIVADPDDTTHQPAIISFNGFVDTTIYITYHDCVDLTDGTGILTLVSVTDNAGSSPASVDCATNTSVIGTVDTDSSGDASWQIGADISTVAGATAYGPLPSGSYLGSFQMTLSY